MTCKDCLYFRRCVVLGVELDIKHNKEADKNCRHFKNKADYAEVKHGYWEEIKCGDGIFDYCFKCSNCGKTTPPKAFPVAPDYCPNCPAKMDGKRSDT
ncbi:MAG: hypothetical protein E7264_12170 [Lachnospiraceae bacterium]|nr:hypothetical protein [Lachnospiraceae bacterium]